MLPLRGVGAAQPLATLFSSCSCRSALAFVAALLSCPGVSSWLARRRALAGKPQRQSISCTTNFTYLHIDCCLARRLRSVDVSGAMHDAAANLLCYVRLATPWHQACVHPASDVQLPNVWPAPWHNRSSDACNLTWQRSVAFAPQLARPWLSAPRLRRPRVAAASALASAAARSRCAPLPADLLHAAACRIPSL